MGEIRIENLTYLYQNNGTAFPALREVNLTVHSGELLCIVGHSGCGKSTLLRLLQGLLQPTQGRILLDGAPVTGPDTDRAIVFQQYSLFPWLRVKKQVLFGIRHAARKLPKQEAEQRAVQMLEKVGMGPYLDRYPCQLSGGMQQRVAIARALAMDPDILLLDEPFGALDAKRRAQLQQLLLDLWSGDAAKKTVVFVTHDIDEALILADRIVFMAQGQILETLEVPAQRPRTPELLEHDAALRACKARILQLFDEDGQEDEEAI